MYLFGSATESLLLFERLFPNSTYNLGILLSSALAFIPILVVINSTALVKESGIIRSLIIISILLVFYIGGIIISLKIGGGSNLHNFDAFIVFLLVFCSYGINQFIVSINNGQVRKTTILFLVISLLVLTTSMSTGATIEYTPSKDAVKGEINLLQDEIDTHDEMVLFISEKQLLATDTISAKNFEDDYETVFLMEMAMSNNSKYLSNFHNDLINNKFSLIITKPIHANLQDNTSRFNIENNKWVKRVEIPILESYKMLLYLPVSNVEIYIPR